MIRLRRLSAAAFLLASLTACEAGSSCGDDPVTLPDSGPGAVVAEFECARCHDAEQTLPNLPRKRDCSGCHQALHAGAFDWTYREDVVREWKAHVTHLVDVPSLTDIDGRFRRDWLIDFLQEPHDVRPGLEAMMPRFLHHRGRSKGHRRLLHPRNRVLPVGGSLRRRSGGRPSGARLERMWQLSPDERRAGPAEFGYSRRYLRRSTRRSDQDGAGSSIHPPAHDARRRGRLARRSASGAT